MNLELTVLARPLGAAVSELSVGNWRVIGVLFADARESVLRSSQAIAADDRFRNAREARTTAAVLNRDHLLA